MSCHNDQVAQAAAPPELLRLCLRHLSCFMGTPWLFRGTSASIFETSHLELQLLTLKLASDTQLSGEEVAKLLVLWLASFPSLLPSEVQHRLLNDASNCDEITLLRQQLLMTGVSSTVVPLALFLQQYLLHQPCYETELQDVVRVFAPLLFSAAYPQGPVARAEHLMTVLLSQALAIFSPTSNGKRNDTASDQAASVCVTTAHVTKESVSPQLALAGPHLSRSFSELYEAAWRSDPIVYDILTGTINSTVTAALFDSDHDADEEQDGMDAADIEDLETLSNIQLLPPMDSFVFCYVSSREPAKALALAPASDLPNPFGSLDASVVVVDSLFSQHPGPPCARVLSAPSLRMPVGMCTAHTLSLQPGQEQALLKQNTFPYMGSGCSLDLSYGASHVMALMA